MSELVEFLRARLNEDEQKARAASGPQGRYTRWDLDEWRGLEESHALIGQGTPDNPCALGHFTATPVPTVQAEHIARHDPARVLRDVEAKRQRIEHYLEIRKLSDPLKDKHQAYVLAEGAVRKSLMFDALPYAGHPEYRDEWRP